MTNRVPEFDKTLPFEIIMENAVLARCWFMDSYDALQKAQKEHNWADFTFQSYMSGINDLTYEKAMEQLEKIENGTGS